MSAEKLMQAMSLAHSKLQVKGIVQGTVTEVSGYDHCTVEIMPGMELYEVRLNSVLGLEGNQVTVKPKLGAKVLVGIIENVKTQAVLLKPGEIEEVYIKIGSAEVIVKENKVKIEANGANLGDELKKLCDEVNKIVVLYGRGPNVAAVTQIKEKFETLFF